MASRRCHACQWQFREDGCTRCRKQVSRVLVRVRHRRRQNRGRDGAGNRRRVSSRRPDIVCFVNGIPLVVIEAKRPDGNAKKGPTIDEGISQSLRNQRHDEIPQLFAYSQLLLSINGSDGRYGTCLTPTTFWATWREEDISEA